MAKIKNPPCAGKVYHSQGNWHQFSTCTRQGFAIENGKWYCKQHLPSEVAKRDTERRARWDRESEINSAKWREHDQMKEAWAILKAINPSDPLSVARELCPQSSRPRKHLPPT